MRRESRGGHHRSDYPTENPLARRTTMTLAEAREIAEGLTEQKRTPHPITA
jgi:aspartate oxidase